MRAARSEALDLFRKWSSEGLAVRCQGSVATFAFSLSGYIQSVSDDELRIFSEDVRSEVVLKLKPEMVFGYADSRTVSGVAKKYESCIIVFFGPVPDEGEPDSIAFAAVGG